MSILNLTIGEKYPKIKKYLDNGETFRELQHSITFHRIKEFTDAEKNAILIGAIIELKQEIESKITENEIEKKIVKPPPKQPSKDEFENLAKANDLPPV